MDYIGRREEQSKTIFDTTAILLCRCESGKHGGGCQQLVKDGSNELLPVSSPRHDSTDFNEDRQKGVVRRK